MDGKPFGEYKEFFYSPETKNEDIRGNLIELLSEIDFAEVVPDWNTMQVIFHDYLNGIDPAGPSVIAIRFESTEYNE